MQRLQERVVIVTGAGRGLGREHALLMAQQGARLVVNDRGGDLRGDGAEASLAESVVAEIEQAGGEAVASHHDVSDWQQAGEMVELATETFGGLDVLVNNAGNLRDRSLSSMSEDEWDAVITVHLKGHAAPAHHAMGYWKARAKAGDPVRASIVHTTSAGGFIGNYGQANYAAAKNGIVALSQVCRLEGARFGVRSNAVGPAAYTRMAAAIPGNRVPEAGTPEYELLNPANVSPLVAWLAGADCPANGQLFHCYGDRIMVLRTPEVAADLRNGGRWSPADLDRELPAHLVDPPGLEDFLPGEADLAVWQKAQSLA